MTLKVASETIDIKVICQVIEFLYSKQVYIRIRGRNGRLKEPSVIELMDLICPHGPSCAGRCI
jgi:hypothetical protein